MQSIQMSKFKIKICALNYAFRSLHAFQLSLLTKALTENKLQIIFYAYIYERAITNYSIKQIDSINI